MTLPTNRGQSGMNNRILAAAVAVATTGLVLTSALASSAADGQGQSAVVTPDGSRVSADTLLASGPKLFVVDPSASGVTKTSDGSTFYPTGDIPDDTTIVIPNSDGSLPGGLTLRQIQDQVAQVRAAADAPIQLEVASPSSAEISQGAITVQPTSSTPTYVYGTAFNTLSKVYKGQEIIGLTNTATAGYGFNVTEGTNQEALGSGLGYYRGYNGTTLGLWSSWYSLGIASSGTNGGKTVPWGNVAGQAQFRAYGMSLSLVAGRFWS